jgi:hypothetical protein
MNVVVPIRSGCRGTPGSVGARSTGEDSKQKTTKEAKALSSAAAKTFVLFVAFCKKSKPYPPGSSLLSFPSVKNPNFPRKRSQNPTQYISERTRKSKTTTLKGN